MNNKLIFGIVGTIASGKGTSAKYLETKYQASTHRFSTMLRDVLNRLHLEISRENMQGLSMILRKQFGENTLARVMAEDVKNDPSRLVVVDGIRRFADIEYLEKIDGFRLVSIDAAAKIRYDRLVSRAENTGDTAKTFEEFLTDELKEADAEIPAVIRKAELKINNDGDLGQLYQQIDNLINTLK